jgi:hypothetical protein
VAFAQTTLPVERVRWSEPAFANAVAGNAIKNYPQKFGKAKVREFRYCKNFVAGIFLLVFKELDEDSYN